MTRSRLVGILAAASLVVTSGTLVAAQDGPTGPEGVDWTLSRYVAPDSVELVAVPFGVTSTLRLESGMASGSGGCNVFGGTYAIDGTSLDFGDELTRTLSVCEDTTQAIEDTYVAALSEVAGWAIEDGVLQLTDAAAVPRLTLEVPDVLLTATQLSVLQALLQESQAQLDLAHERIDNANIPKLRDRIKALEADNQTLKDQLAAQRAPKPTPKAQPTTGSFNKAEQVLLKGIPSRIANHCSSWRRPVPPGTVAAVRCTPNTTAASVVFYYLLEAEDAQSAFDSEMAVRNVPLNTSDPCASGRRGQKGFGSFGPGFWIGEGCDRDPGPQTFVAFVDAATACKQLNVAGQRMKAPAYYITLQGNHADIARTFDWAKRGANAANSYLGISGQIPSKLKLSPPCNVRSG